MAREIKEIEKELMALSVNERAEIARNLLLSLEETNEADVEQAWIEEAESRYEAYRNGKTTARSVNEALASARESLKK